MKEMIARCVLMVALIASSSMSLKAQTATAIQCNYKWQDLKQDSVISVPITDFSLNNQLTSQMKSCLMPLVRIMKTSTKQKLWITLIQDNEQKDHNKKVLDLVYNFLLKNGLTKRRVVTMIHSAHHLPEPITDNSTASPISLKGSQPNRLEFTLSL